MLPVEDSWIVIESLENLKLRESPRMKLFNGLLNPHNDIRIGPFEEINVLLGQGHSFLEFIGV